jgi:hypothetical protein
LETWSFPQEALGRPPTRCFLSTTLDNNGGLAHGSLLCQGLPVTNRRLFQYCLDVVCILSTLYLSFTFTPRW